MSPDYVSVLREKIAACRVIADRVERSSTSLVHHFPIAPEAVGALDEATVLVVDSMLLRYSNLVSNLQDHVFRLVVLAEERDPTVMTNRDRARFMEKIGVLDSADAFTTAVLTRNKLAHQYPGDPDRQAELLNDTWAAIPTVLAAQANAERVLRERGYL